jgi:hypothetical protein
MTNFDKTHIQVLDNCATLGLQSSEEDLKKLMQLLMLPISYWESALLVLQQGRWRNTADPVRYINAAARREHRKIERGRRSGALVGCISELKLPSNKDGMQMSHDDAIDRLNSGSLEDDWEIQFAKQRVQPKFLVADSPHEDAHRNVDYSALMDEVTLIAGLSKGRRDVIERVFVWLSMGLTRQQILRGAGAGMRNQLQAAFKWIQRNKPLLKKVLSGRP